jgi:hypothetical protein
LREPALDAARCAHEGRELNELDSSPSIRW